MKMTCNLMRITAFVLAIAAWAPLAHAATIPVTDWVVHNSNGTVNVTNGNTNSPTFTAADINFDVMTLMAPFDAITLVNDGDYIKLTTTLSMANRSTPGVNTLNNNLRFGLFDGPGSPVVAEDAPNYGFFAQYANAAQTHLKVQAQATAATTSPMDMTFATIGSVALGNVVADPEDSSIQGANPTADYEMTITRSGGKLNITGKISGGDYLSTFAVIHSSVVFPADGSFTFDRVGFYLGNNVNAQEGSTFSNVIVETNVAIPEPGSLALVSTLLIGITLAKRRGR